MTDPVIVECLTPSDLGIEGFKPLSLDGTWVPCGTGEAGGEDNRRMCHLLAGRTVEPSAPASAECLGRFFEHPVITDLMYPLTEDSPMTIPYTTCRSVRPQAVCGCGAYRILWR